MRIKRRLPILIGVLLVIAALVLVVQLRKHAPPEPARLLPAGDAFFYVNLSRVRWVNAVSQLPTVSHDPEYERFIQETGFQFERDLDRAAVAVHYPASWSGKTQPGSLDQPRFSEVFEGSIHAEKLSAYLRKMSRSVENYRSVEIFSIPIETRTLRVALLGVDTVAASNHDDPAVIRGMIDRSRKLASPFAGPAFLRQYYKYVPSTLPVPTLAWAIMKVENSSPQSPFANGFWPSLFSKPAVVVVSARYVTALHLKVEAFADSPEEAQHIAQQTDTFLSIFHAAEQSASEQGTDADAKKFFESLKVDKHDNRAELTAILPVGFIRKLFTEPPPLLTPQQPVPNPEPAPPSKKHRSKGPAPSGR
jgi:hypothetical protein